MQHFSTSTSVKCQPGKVKQRHAAPPLNLEIYQVGICRILYSGKNDPKIDADFDRVEEGAVEFAKAFEGNLASLSGDALAAGHFQTFEDAGEVMGGIMSYSYLLYAGNMTAEGVSGFSAKQHRAFEPHFQSHAVLSRWS